MTEPSRSRVEHWLATRPDEVRVLGAFVEHMQRELAANSGKGDRPGWMRDTPRDLLAEIQHHYVKLHAVVVEVDREEKGQTSRPVPWGATMATRELVAEFAADVANMAMMLADRCGALSVEHDVRPSRLVTRGKLACWLGIAEHEAADRLSELERQDLAAIEDPDPDAYVVGQQLHYRVPDEILREIGVAL